MSTWSIPLTNIYYLAGDEPLPKFNDRVKKRNVKEASDDFINDGPIVIGESIRKNGSRDNRKECDKRHPELQEECKRKTKLCQKPPEAKTFEELIRLAQVCFMAGHRSS